MGGQRALRSRARGGGPAGGVHRRPDGLGRRRADDPDPARGLLGGQDLLPGQGRGHPPGAGGDPAGLRAQAARPRHAAARGGDGRGRAAGGAAVGRAGRHQPAPPRLVRGQCEPAHGRRGAVGGGALRDRLRRRSGLLRLAPAEADRPGALPVAGGYTGPRLAVLFQQAARAATSEARGPVASFRQARSSNPVRRQPVRSTVEPVEATKVKINVVVDPDELGPAIERTARRLGRELKVPGFRKGKVPRQVLEARIGRETLIAEAIEHEVDLPDYRGIQVERPKLEVTDEHVDTQLDQLRERFAQLEVIGRPLAKGDYAQIDLRATRHTQEIPELTRTDFLYEVGSGTVVPELDPQLEGSRKGDILKFNATLPESAGEQLGGQEVTFTVLVKEAKAKILPKLDDDFAQEASEFDTLDELRSHLRERLEEGAEAQNRSETETSVLGKYLDEVDVPLPESLVNDELQFRASRFVQQLNMIGIPLDQYLQGAETTQEQLEADLRAQAERAVKVQLVLEAIAEAEGMDADDEEIEAEILRQAQRIGRDPQDVRKALGQRGSGPIRGDILRTKALAYLVEHAQVSDL